MKLPSPLLVISDRKQTPGPLPEVAEAILAAGGRWLLLREKDLAPAERLTLARDLKRRAEGWGAALSISGDLEAAAALGLGLHLPRDGDPAAARRRLGPEAVIGLSTHSLAEALSAQAAGADYVTLSPAFESPSKPGYGPALGPEGLATVAARLSIPVLALGGMTAGRVASCLDAGAAGIAVMGGILAAPDPGAATAAFRAALADWPEAVAADRMAPLSKAARSPRT